MPINHRYVAIYPSGAGDPMGGHPYADPSALYAASYNDLTTMEAAENGNLTNGGDYTNPTVLHIEIVPSNGTWRDAPDANDVDWDGWKTDKNGDGSCVEIKTYGSARSRNGLYDSGAYILKHSGTSDHVFHIDNDTTVDEYLDLEVWNIQVHKAPTSGAACMRIEGGGYHGTIRFNGCYFKEENSSVTCYNRDDSQADVILQNCIMDGFKMGYDMEGSYGFYHLDTDGRSYLYNCTIFGMLTNGIQTSNMNLKVDVYNTVLFNNFGNDWGGSTHEDHVSNNASDNGNADDANHVDMSPGTEADGWNTCFPEYRSSFPDVTVKDTNSYLYRAGLPRTADPFIPAEDIAGNPRPLNGPVCIGAFEYIVPTMPANTQRIQIVSQVYRPPQKPPLGSQIDFSHPLAKGLVGCWLFNEGSGIKVHDISGYGNHGDVSGTSGYWNGGDFKFNGTNNYVSISDNNLFTFNDGASDTPFSIITTVNKSDITTCEFFSKGSIPTNDFEYRFGTTVEDKLLFYCYDESASAYVGRLYNTAITAYQNKTIHLAATYNGMASNIGFRIYLNGERVDDGNFSSGSYSGMENKGADTLIGKFSANYSTGSMRFLYVFRRVLTPSDIASIHQSPYAMFKEPRLYYNPIVPQVEATYVL